MIVLELTSQHNKKRVFIVTDTITICDIAGQQVFGSTRLERGCVVDDGKHNNSGYRVEETYDEVRAMIEAQLSNPKR